MNIVRLVARPMIGSYFVWSGRSGLLQPAMHVDKAEPVAERAKPLLERAPVQLPTDTKTLIRINAGVQIAAGAMLGIGWFPRMSALVLAGSMVPTTLAEHRFWEETDKTERNVQAANFFKNVAITGGLLIAGFDTEGRPGLSYRARHATADAKRAATLARREAALARREATAQVAQKARELVH